MRRSARTGVAAGVAIASAAALGVSAAVCLLPSCSDYGGVSYAQPPAMGGDASYVPAAIDDAGSDGGVVGLGVGADCNATHACREGLACKASRCAPSGATPAGATCTLNSECVPGFYCGAERACTAAGHGTLATTCHTDGDCVSGFRCVITGLSAECRIEGAGDVGGACNLGSDCLGGLTCAGRVCKPLPVSTTGVPVLSISSWPGETCVDDTGPTTAYFRVPRGTGDGDFYRLPFPNDVRLLAGRVKLDGHPTPGADVLGFDVVDRYLRYIEGQSIGFSPYGTVTLRFSAALDFDTLKLAGALRLVDLTPGMNGAEVGFTWSASTGRTPYLCANALRVRPRLGLPFAQGHTYGFVVSTAVKDAGGVAIARSSDLTALLADATPTDGALAGAYLVYKPLRDWAAAKTIPTATILSGTVFTIGRPAQVAAKLALAVASAPAPSVTGWVKCGGTTPSPCPQATFDRACPTGSDPLYDEFHAIATLPRFQKGNAPYTAFGQGGLDYAADGTPQPTGTTDVCLALTVPKGAAMPATGWPLVVYAHGAGGSFRSHVNEGLANRLSAIVDGATPLRAAILGIDQVEHGTRRGLSTELPQNLFYDYANPAAAVGNPLQGAADQMALVRLARGLNLSAAASPTGAALKFGTIAFWGQAEGATLGAIALPYIGGGTTGVAGAVLAGEGGSFLDALVTKKNPVNLADVVPFALADATVDASHPLLSLLQLALDPADPLNHAPSLVASPVTPGSAKHVFMPFGQADSYTPSVVQATFAVAAGLGLASPAPSVATAEPVGEIKATAIPTASNYTDGTRAISAYARQYAPTSYDGHFVSTRDITAVIDGDRYIADVLANRTPKLGR